MKLRIRKHAMLLMMAAAVVAGVAVAGPAVAQNETGTSLHSPTVIVSGRGQVQAAPDQATVHLGAEAQAQTAQAAQAQVNVVMQRALQQIRAVGIEERHIQTSGLQLFPVYRQQQPGESLPRGEESPRIVGYRASNTVQVQVHDLRLVGRVIDAGIGAGANRLESISFSLQNDLPARNNALQLAVQEARIKAQTLADALDMRLGSIVEVNEGGVDVRPPQPFGGMEFQRAAMDTPVQPGEMNVQASVTIRYRLMPR